MNPSDILVTDQVAIVTGGANGIGEGIALTLARFGADVAIADVDTEKGRQVVAAIQALGRRALLVPTDCADTGQIRSMVEQAAGHFGRLDILVNNVGGSRQTDFLEQSERSWKRHIDLNLVSMLAATQASARAMIAGGRGGTIINIASSEGLRAAPGYAVYAACKAGMISFTRTMALELSEHAIRVFALAPDMLVTPGLQPYYDAATPGEAAARDRYIPLGRLGKVEEIGSVAVFLASRMASYLTGVTLPVDAGTLASSGWTRLASGGWALYHD
ncbi:SDR family NAD(P)-dependent oxidoreductase [Fulvimonas soli]|jgi:NAD(P)-dependent dehydrogenase (short-subunit alcohol dehydrogenase family)|uniref:NAD(P)-dependent dehydrogenase (Short-subunit alcohol dehydrogenase family) n=1 Tax=Fulvimonas soli TaxID=155197 RepID=A0A316IN50_9GAMM|nr:SDR family oxidoreductase [Fulvimonas soli]PWK91918.1 NAD(P)-dependent dehydrogenase (short-subunit alcohol dehydrogenase family) [Fulvimonas soli]TNY26045.1 short-chain dehydrogenase [Fulvimonas soli]